MRISRKYYGKWVATTEKGKVVQDASTLDGLMKKVDRLRNKASLRIGCVPKNPAFIGLQ